MLTSAASPPPFDVQTFRSNDRITVTVTGELDHATAPGVDRAIALAETQEPDLLVIDLCGLTFFDVSGVRLLGQAKRRARRRGYRLVVECGGGPAQRVLSLCELPHGAFDFTPAAPRLRAA